MNPVKHAYCRIYQFMFKIAIPLLPYHFPKELHALSDVPAALQEKNIQSVLIVTDAAIHSCGIIEPLKQALRESNIHYCVYDRTVPNPTIHNVEEAREMYIRHACGALIGFGGGSAIDCAKAVGARIARPRKSMRRLGGIFKVARPLPFTIAVPSTAGTGSETTLAALITDSDNHCKFTLYDFALIPNIAVLDPEVTRTLPRQITATTGMDALTHAVEAYIGRSTVHRTRRDALEAVRLISQNLETAYQNGDDMNARRSMLRAAYLAGRAFTVSYVGYCHAVAHSLGGKYNTPHGLANAVLLPYVLEAYGDCVYNQLKGLAIAAGIADDHTPAAEAAKAFIDMIRQMNARMGIPTKLKGINRADIPALAARADHEANPLYPVPKLMTARELEQFYLNVMEESK